MKAGASIGRIAAWAFAALGALLLAGAAAAALEWRSSSNSGAHAELLSGPSLSPSSGAKLGEPVAVKALFKCPWGRRVAELSATPGEGSQLLSSPSSSLKAVRWGFSVLEVSAKVQPFRTGETGEGLLGASFSNGSSPRDSFDLKIPKFAVEAVKVPPGSSLAIAGKLPEPKALWPWILAVALAVCVFAALALAWLRRARRVAPPPPPWTLALAALADLRARLSRGQSSAEQCLAELTDIVRGYLERRFAIRAERQTTPEFLSCLERGSGPLTELQRSFLKQFLAAADMVKFAKLSADRALLDDALLKAEKLVLESVPSEKSEEGARK